MSITYYEVPGMSDLIFSSAYSDQQDTNDCWIISARYLLAWKKRTEKISLDNLVEHTKYKRKYENNETIDVDEVNDFYGNVCKFDYLPNLGMPYTDPVSGLLNFNHTASYWFEKLREKGPIIVTIDFSANTSHAVILYGYYGTGENNASSQLFLIDTATGKRQHGLLFPHFVDKTRKMFSQNYCYNAWCVGNHLPANI